MNSKRALGKGLGALLGDAGATAPQKIPMESEPGPTFLGDREVRMVAVGDLSMNPHQPRKTMTEERLQELAHSIRDNGILQPVLIRKHMDRFELIAGERRVRAAQIAGLDEIPAIICTMAEAESMKVALLENISGSADYKDEYEAALTAKEEAEAARLFASKQKKGLESERHQLKDQKEEAERFHDLLESKAELQTDLYLWLLYHLDQNLFQHGSRMSEVTRRKSIKERALS